MRKKLRERITEALDMPKDLALNLPKLNMTGDKELYIENYKGIVEYSETLVRIKTTHHILKVTGKALQINTITDEDLLISGQIISLEFQS